MMIKNSKQWDRFFLCVMHMCQILLQNESLTTHNIYNFLGTILGKKEKQEQVGRNLGEYLASHIAPLPLVLGNLGESFEAVVAPVRAKVLLKSRWVECNTSAGVHHF